MSVRDVVPCIWCKINTSCLGTVMCNGCWELYHRIEDQPDLALKMLIEIVGERMEFEGLPEVHRERNEQERQLELSLEADGFAFEALVLDGASADDDLLIEVNRFDGGAYSIAQTGRAVQLLLITMQEALKRHSRLKREKLEEDA